MNATHDARTNRRPPPDARTTGRLTARCLRVFRLLLVVPLGACSRGPATERGSVSVRDSAGIRLVTVDPVQDSVRWRLEAPLAEFGRGPDVELYRVIGARRLDDGRVVVGNGGASELLVFEPGGRLLRRLGREGDGPGEYRSLAWVSTTGGDTLLTYDARLRRTTISTIEGSTIASWAPEPTGDAFYPSFLGIFDDGTLLATIGEPLPDDAAAELRYRDSLTTLRYDRNGHLLGEPGRFPNQEGFIVRSETGDLAWSEIPYGRRTAIAVDATVFHVVTGDAYEIRTYDMTGTLRRVLRLERARSEVTLADRRAFREERRERLSKIEDPTRRRLHEKLLQQLPFPEHHAGYSDILVTRRGELWARRDDTAWDVFAENGRLIGEARLPARFVVYEIGDDYVLGLQKDEIGIEHVTLHRLVRDSGSPVDSVAD